MQKQLHVFFSGRVQGVGFRFTVQRIATDLGISGWVKNLYDGRVEVVAEQEDKVLKSFVEQTERYFKNDIKNKQISWSDVTGLFKEFEIRF